MKNGEIALHFADLAAVAWVWQCEIEPRVRMLLRRIPAGKGLRSPSRHIGAYRKLVDELSRKSVAAIGVPEGALHLLNEACGIMHVFAPRWSVESDDPAIASAIANLNDRTPHLTDFAAVVLPPRPSMAERARGIIRELLTIDDNGECRYSYPCCPALPYQGLIIFRRADQGSGVKLRSKVS